MSTATARKRKPGQKVPDVAATPPSSEWGKPRPERFTKAQYLREVIALYRQHHPGPFATAAVAAWSIARGLQTVPDTDEGRRQRIVQARARFSLSTTTPAGIRAFDADHHAAELQKRIDAWRADWLRYLLALCAADDYKLALRLLLSGLADLNAQVQPAIVNRHETIARAANPIEPLMQLGIDVAWFDDQPGTLPTDAVEAHARAAELNLAAHWKANLAGPLTERLFELLPLDQLNDYALAVRLPDTSLKTRTTKPELVAAIIAHKRTRDLLPPCIKPVTLDPPQRKGAKRK